MHLHRRRVRCPVLEVGHKNGHTLRLDFKEEQCSRTKVLPNYKLQLLLTGLDINLFWIRVLQLGQLDLRVGRYMKQCAHTPQTLILVFSSSCRQR